MPHLVLEYSAELADSHNIAALVDDLFDTACAHPAFAANPAAVKARSIACENARSGVTPQSFAHLTVCLLTGRTTEVRADLAEALLAVMDRHLPDVGSLSVEPVEMDTETYRKRAL